MTIIANCIPLHRQPTFIGLVLGLGQLGTACGPLIGGALTQHVT